MINTITNENKISGIKVASQYGSKHIISIFARHLDIFENETVIKTVNYLHPYYYADGIVPKHDVIQIT